MKVLLILSLIAVSFNLWSHGDHSTPGSVPPAPHGGTVKKASVVEPRGHGHTHVKKKKHGHGKSHGHGHNKKKNKKLFFEAILKNNTLKVFPLSLDHDNHKAFITLKTEDFKKHSMTVLDPRKKKYYSPKILAHKDHWSASFDDIKGRRFIISIATKYSHSNYGGKVQVERK
jgi:hypothetical protein